MTWISLGGFGGVEAATAEDEAVRAAYDLVKDLYPDVTLGASAGSTGLISDFLTAPTKRFGFGLAIHWQANQNLARARSRRPGGLAPD